ncbi:MAG: hypothetical protein J0M08_13525 [Bacteroidetes bacterium]|nr:hypothetical protein [Bacteroidota bacterium]
MTYKHSFFFLSTIVATLFIGCKKDVVISSKKVQYEVIVLPNNEVSILYNSDYNTDNKSEKEITVTNTNGSQLTGNTWFATHIQNGAEEYYIKVKYTNYSNPTNLSYGVFVYVNDTLRDYVIKNSYVPEIEIKGYVQ